MIETRLARAVLLADITGSTALYETLGDGEAARRIGRCVDWMRDAIEAQGGVFVAAKGDDVLATFEAADTALRAIEAILAEMPEGGLSIHAGLHFGWVVSARGDIFGDAVNLTVRLAGLANPGEVLISRHFTTQLPPERASALRPLDAMNFKGKSAPVDVFSLSDDTRFEHTRLLDAPRPHQGRSAPQRLSVLLSFGEARHMLEEEASISLGRGSDNDIVVPRPWVSRRHATIAVSGKRVQLTDRSSYGSYLAIAGAAELVARRETVILAGSGRLSLGTSVDDLEAAVIDFEVEVG